MKSKITMSLFVCLLFFSSTTVYSQKNEEIANDAFKNWSQFNKGTTATFKMITTLRGKKSSEARVVYTLKEKDNQKVVIEMDTALTIEGMEVKSPPNLVTYDKDDEISIEKPDGLPEGAKYQVTDKGTEEIKLGNTVYKCKWYTCTMEVLSIKAESKVWMTDEVPGMVVKMVTKTTGGSETSMNLLEFAKK